MSDGDPPPPLPEPDAPDVSPPDTERKALRIEWLVIVGALIGPMIVGALHSRYLYGPFAPAMTFAYHPLEFVVMMAGMLAPPLAILFYILHLRGVRPGSIGFRPLPRPSDIGWGLLLMTSAIGIDLVLYMTSDDPVWMSEAQSYVAAWRESGADGRWPWMLGLLGLLLLSVLIGAVEESLRAYVIVRTDTAWGGGIAFGAFASFFLFIMYHVYYGGVDLLAVGLWGLVMTVYFVIRRDAWALVIGHALTDIVAFAWFYATA